MASTIWPAIPPHELRLEVEATQAAEIRWLLNLVQQESFASWKSGLQECADLIAAKDPGATLVLSSVQSESVKGFVTRSGSRIVKGDIQLRLPFLSPPRGHASYPIKIRNPFVLPQLSHLQSLLNQALDIIDISRWTGDPLNGPFIAGQLRLLHDAIDEARRTLKGMAPLTAQSGKMPSNGQDERSEVVLGSNWWEGGGLDAEIRDPRSALFSAHLTIHDAAVVLHIRSLEISSVSNGRHGSVSSISSHSSDSQSHNHPSGLSSLSIRSRLGLMGLIGSMQRPQPHDESEATFRYKGQNVRVLEKVRVESADPSLMAIMAKLSALAHSVASWRLKLDTVMGVDIDED